MNKKYEISDQDIESALRFLKIYDPENATPEAAKASVNRRIGFYLALMNPSQ